MDDERWDKLGDNAAAVGKDRTAVLKEFIDWFNRKPGAELPERPAGSEK